MVNLFHHTIFRLSAAKADQFPEDEGAEVAFIGRSNCGKSTAINVLTQQRNLARTSKTPGRTQCINFFNIDDQRRLVDLPGYGYAKIPDRFKKHWHHLIEDYLQGRHSLKGLVLLMDSRRPFTSLDQQVLDWNRELGLETHVLLTKVDKLTRGMCTETLRKAKVFLSDFPLCDVQLFSATKKIGIDELRKKLVQWLF